MDPETRNHKIDLKEKYAATNDFDRISSRMNKKNHQPLSAPSAVLVRRNHTKDVKYHFDANSQRVSKIWINSVFQLYNWVWIMTRIKDTVTDSAIIDISPLNPGKHYVDNVRPRSLLAHTKSLFIC